MWFSDVNLNTDKNFVNSRVRLVRNLEHYHFPGKLEKHESTHLVDKVLHSLSDIETVEGKKFISQYLYSMPEIEKLSLRECRIINSTLVEKSLPTGIILSEDNKISIVINGDDHIRLQFLETGMCLDELWERANIYDDYINSHFTYAFDEKYGYLTSYPTNIGTGLKANIILHLPVFSSTRNFNNIISDLSRFNVTVRGVYGQGEENYGRFYDVSSSKTLGTNERETLMQISRVAMHLNMQENSLRRITFKNHLLERQDEAYRSYGILKYARKLNLKDVLIHISTLMMGAADGVIRFDRPEKLYELTILSQPSCIMRSIERPLSKDEVDEARAIFIRENLPKVLDGGQDGR